MKLQDNKIIQFFNQSLKQILNNIGIKYIKYFIKTKK